MNATPAAVALVQTIGREILAQGRCVVDDRRLDLIVGAASDSALRVHRLQQFALRCHWRAESRCNGRAAMFFPIPDHVAN